MFEVNERKHYVETVIIQKNTLYDTSNFHGLIDKKFLEVKCIYINSPNQMSIKEGIVFVSILSHDTC